MCSIACQHINQEIPVRRIQNTEQGQQQSITFIQQLSIPLHTFQCAHCIWRMHLAIVIDGKWWQQKNQKHIQRWSFELKFNHKQSYTRTQPHHMSMSAIVKLCVVYLNDASLFCTKIGKCAFNFAFLLLLLRVLWPVLVRQ